MPSGGADEAGFVKFMSLLPRADLYGDRSNKVVGVGHGFRFNINDRLILAPSIGFRHCVFAGTGEINEYSGGVHYYWEEDITGEVTSVFANFAVLF